MTETVAQTESEPRTPACEDCGSALEGADLGRDMCSGCDRRRKNATLFDVLAKIVGYNELARQAPTLNEKVYCRIARQHAYERYVELGGKIKLTEEDEVLVTLGSERPFILLREKDIGQMRAAVAAWDAEHPTEPVKGTSSP